MSLFKKASAIQASIYKVERQLNIVGLSQGQRDALELKLSGLKLKLSRFF